MWSKYQGDFNIIQLIRLVGIKRGFAGRKELLIWNLAFYIFNSKARSGEHSPRLLLPVRDPRDILLINITGEDALF